MTSLMVLPLDTALAQALVEALALVGHADVTLLPVDGTASHLGATVVAAAPRQVIVAGLSSAQMPMLCELLGLWPGGLPCAVSLIGAGAAEVEALMPLGLTGWWPVLVLAEPENLTTLMSVDQQRWQREGALRADAARAHDQLDERKWVERAKGVLMQVRGMGEEEAFRLLRGASMHTNVRVGDVSRSVLKAAQWGEAINRAGQLRMLSQRLVKLAAQRLVGIDVRRARTLQDEATQRAQENLEYLAAMPLLAEAPASLHAALAQAAAAWAPLKAALEKRQTTVALAGIDTMATALLAAAEDLTESLEQAGGRRALHIVNLCGRQRMRVQRLAKTALLDLARGRPSTAEALAPLLDEFEAALVELERAPLSSAEIRDALARARNEWLLVLRCLRGDGTDHRADLAQAGDVLLDTFDHLTAAYEHSLQVIMS